MSRPSIDESLAEEVKRIHRQNQNESAGTFQEALDTVVQLALESNNNPDQQSSEKGWYPGKYAGKVLNRVVGENTDRSVPSPTPTHSRQSIGSEFPASQHSPSETAIFKTKLNDEKTVELPAPEIDALGLDNGDILQVYAYLVNDSESTTE